jgi:hypothetical protein
MVKACFGKDVSNLVHILRFGIGYVQDDEPKQSDYG